MSEQVLTITTNNYLYTASVALSPDFLPLHWNIPNWEDWNILNAEFNLQMQQNSD